MMMMRSSANIATSILQCIVGRTQCIARDANANTNTHAQSTAIAAANTTTSASITAG